MNAERRADEYRIGTVLAVAGGVTAAGAEYTLRVEQTRGNGRPRPVLVDDEPRGIVFASGPSAHDHASGVECNTRSSIHSHAGDSRAVRWDLAATHGGHPNQ